MTTFDYIEPNYKYIEISTKNTQGLWSIEKKAICKMLTSTWREIKFCREAHLHYGRLQSSCDAFSFVCKSYSRLLLAHVSLEEVMKTIVLTVVFFLTGCSMQPVHYYKTEGIDEKVLSSVSYRANEIIILEVDEEKYPGKVEEYVYLKPGIHKFNVQLSWTDLIPVSGIYLSKVTNSSNVRVRCLDMKPGHKYYLYAREPGPDWRLVYHDETNSPYSLHYDAIPVPMCN